MPLDDGQQILEYLDIQGSMDMVTKSGLLEEVRRRGGRISDRQLTTYMSEGLVPRSVRIGSRSGAYPRIVVDLVMAIVLSRHAGLSIDAIRELIPLWKHLVRARRERRVDLAEFEYVARQHVLSLEAAYAVPWLFKSALPSPLHEEREASKIEFIDKSGKAQRHSAEDPISVEFIIAEQDETSNEVRRRSSLLMTLPVVRDGASVILGIPNGVELPPCPRQDGTAPHTGEGPEGRTRLASENASL